MDTQTRASAHTARFPRAELEEMVRRWIVAHDRATELADWRSTLGAYYTDDAEYRWELGPEETGLSRGVKEIREIAIGSLMEGFERWSYPYVRVVIDEVKGEVVGYWKQISPYKRPDGTYYEVPGLGSSWFRYAGNYKWSHQHDHFDLGSVIATLRDLAAVGYLPEPLKQKMRRRARGEVLEGNTLREGRASLSQKLRGNLALARIALLGR
jgi:hypothetical protein